MKQTKKCTGVCGLEKSLECFSFRDKTKTILQNICRKCVYQMYQKPYDVRNKEQKRERTKKSKDKNKEKNKVQNRENARKRRREPAFRIKNAISCGIRSALKTRGQKKKGSCWKYLSYSPQELWDHFMNHPEREEWMIFETYGRFDDERRTWQIDHIIPQSSFQFKTMDDPNFQKCWALSNLRPLESKKNKEKSNKLLDILSVLCDPDDEKEK